MSRHVSFKNTVLEGVPSFIDGALYHNCLPYTCCECKFNSHGNNYGQFICKKRFKDLQLDGDTLVKIENL